MPLRKRGAKGTGRAVDATASEDDHAPGVIPPENTVAGCHALADSDLSRAAATDTWRGRRKLEASAARWEERAEMVQRVETSFNKRDALDMAERARSRAAEG
jgi:hypothetical protein